MQPYDSYSKATIIVGNWNNFQAIASYFPKKDFFSEKRHTKLHWFPLAHLLPRICVYLLKYTYERAEKNLTLTFPNCKFGEGQYAFYPIKLSRFAEKMKFVRNTKIS